MADTRNATGPYGGPAFAPGQTRTFNIRGLWNGGRLESFGEAVAKVLEFRSSEEEAFEMRVEEWRKFEGRASQWPARTS